MEDVEPSYQINLDSEVSRYTGDGGVHTLEEIESMIKDHVLVDYEKHGYGRFAVDYKQNNQFIGFAGLKFLPELNEVDIGYRFARSYWGQGLATEGRKGGAEFWF